MCVKIVLYFRIMKEGNGSLVLKLVIVYMNRIFDNNNGLFINFLNNVFKYIDEV